MPSILTANSIIKFYKKNIPILNGITFEFHQGQSYSIQGVSGSGKSTFLNILSGFDKPTSGNIQFNDKNIHELSNQEHSEILNKKLGFVFQFHYLINELTALENIMLAGQIQGLPIDESRKKANQHLKFLGLSKRINHYPYELSGGEQQRVSIARSLFNQPDFILADEPTGNLDAGNAKIVVELLLKCKEEQGLGIIVCSHDQYVCESMENIITLNSGMLQNNIKSLG